LILERYGSLEALPADIRLVATVGAFDGVHRGHAALVGRLVREARGRSAQAVVVTFEPHPAAVLRGRAPDRLCDPAERDARLADLGVDHLVVERFDAALAAQTAEAFVGRIGAGGRLVALVMTAGTAFGRGRGGTLGSMRALGVAEGFAVVEAPQLRASGEVISSSRIRAAIALGRLTDARRLLGRPYAVTGTVVHGDGRGRRLGFPTANLALDGPVALPPNGIYAARVAWGHDPTRPERQVEGVASLGVRPTFGIGERVLEVFLLDTDEDLYDLRLRLVFVRRQRGERRFSNAERLVEQMERDVARARRVLTAASTRGAGFAGSGSG
jgi:riboflavin kinase/FMN adenylyltransferase